MGFRALKNEEYKMTSFETTLKLAGKHYSSRLILGTSGYPNLDIMEQSLLASKTEMVTVALRRVNVAEKSSGRFMEMLHKNNFQILPNTAGCHTAAEAILTAHMARELLNTSWIKLEVIGDEYSLYPDSEELLKAAAILIKEGFVVFPYCNDDPVVCRKLADMGCAAVMPLASPIGSGQGIRNPNNLELIRKTVSIPIIVDAGIGAPSDVCFALELGADAVLLNTAIAKAKNPVEMALAMREAAMAGFTAYRSGLIPEKKFATPSTPDVGKMNYIREKK